MALSFSRYEPVGFGDLRVMPKVNPEKRLRLQTLKITEENLETVCELLASCFGEHATEIANFMKANMFLRDYLELRTYLLEGERGVEAYRAQVSRVMDTKIDEVLSKLPITQVEEVTDNA